MVRVRPMVRCFVLLVLLVLLAALCAGAPGFTQVALASAQAETKPGQSVNYGVLLEEFDPNGQILTRMELKDGELFFSRNAPIGELLQMHYTLREDGLLWYTYYTDGGNIHHGGRIVDYFALSAARGGAASIEEVIAQRGELDMEILEQDKRQEVVDLAAMARDERRQMQRTFLPLAAALAVSAVGFVLGLRWLRREGEPEEMPA